jgi:hypothetical protein
MSVIGGLQRNGVTMVTQFYDILNYVEWGHCVSRLR